MTLIVSHWLLELIVVYRRHVWLEDLNALLLIEVTLGKYAKIMALSLLRIPLSYGQKNMM